MFRGEWKSDRANGYGILAYANGNKYAGNWADDKRHGYGVFEAGEGYANLLFFFSPSHSLFLPE